MKKMIKTTLFTLLLTAGILPLYATDGDVFTANTEEGVEMTFKVTSEEEKTCQVGNDFSAAIDYSYAGKITIPMETKGYKVTSIGEGAFWGCESLTSIDIPSSVTAIGEKAFDFCCSLTSITIPEGVTSIGLLTFYNCESLTSITIPEGVTYIGDAAFRYCESLTSIDIPSSVTSIGEEVFYSCYSLTSITIPASVT